MEEEKNRRGATRSGVLGIIGRRWLYTILASLLLFQLNPGAWSTAWVRWAFAVFIATGVCESALFWVFPKWAFHPVGFLAHNLLNLGLVALAVTLTGRTGSPLLLLYPVVMLSGVVGGPRLREALVVGGVGFVSFVAAAWPARDGPALAIRVFAVESAVLFLFFLSTWVVSSVIAEKNIRLERSNRALEKFAAGLKATNEKLERLSFTDGVTGVYNYRFFQLRLREELSRARRYRLPLALMMVDVDGFKRYNDSHGHPVGDRVLQAVAQALRENVRDLDTVCRYGGDEFSVILNDAGADTATTIGERVRKAVERCAAAVGAPAGITVSLGIAVYPENAQNAEELVKFADEALYRVKLSRRNGVQVYSSVIDDLRTELGEGESPSLLNTLQTLIAVINARDRYTYGHSERVMQYALALGEELGLTPEDLRLLRYAAFLHDIGKIEIGREILNKRGPLTEEEYAVVKRHTLYGVQIIEPIQTLERIVAVVLHHHERFDGQGYPAGLAGAEIPLLARILAVADAFDAMRSHRPYREALTLPAALEEVRRGRGAQFDPLVVDALLGVSESRPGLFETELRRDEALAEGHRD